MAIYRNLEELRDAYAARGSTEPLMLDNDHVGMYVDDQQVFDSHPDDVLEQALTLLGFRWEHA